MRSNGGQNRLWHVKTALQQYYKRRQTDKPVTKGNRSEITSEGFIFDGAFIAFQLCFSKIHTPI